MIDIATLTSHKCHSDNHKITCVGFSLIFLRQIPGAVGGFTQNTDCWAEWLGNEKKTEPSAAWSGKRSGNGRQEEGGSIGSVTEVLRENFEVKVELLTVYHEG